MLFGVLKEPRSVCRVELALVQVEARALDLLKLLSRRYLAQAILRGIMTRFIGFRDLRHVELVMLLLIIGLYILLETFWCLN